MSYLRPNVIILKGRDSDKVEAILYRDGDVNLTDLRDGQEVVLTKENIKELYEHVWNTTGTQPETTGTTQLSWLSDDYGDSSGSDLSN